MDIVDLTAQEKEQVLSYNEDHFTDFKSKAIKPSKLQQTFVSFANKDGGDLYIGIEDERSGEDRVKGFANQEEANQLLSTLLWETNPSVENVNVEFLNFDEQGLVLHINVPKSPKVHYTSDGSCYVRSNAETKKIIGEQVTALGYSKGAESYEKRTVPDYDSTELLNSPILHDYIQRVGISQSPVDFLRKNRIIKINDEEIESTVGGILLFDEVPQSVLDKRCGVKVHRLRTTSAEYDRTQLLEVPRSIDGDIENLILNTIAQVKKYIDGTTYTDSSGNVIKLKYPPEALQEILVNSVIHRDYSLGDDIHVRIYDDRIEVESPGRLPGTMSVANLYEERFSRNPTIVRALHRLPNPLNHDIGEGLITAKNELRKVGLVEPEFINKENSFVVIIRHQMLSSVEDAIIKFFEDHPDGEISNRDVRVITGEQDLQKVKRTLQKLARNNVIRVKDKSVPKFQYTYVKV